MAAPLPGARLLDDGPLSVSLAGVPHFILNTIALREPVSAESLPATIRAAKQHAANCPAPWLLITCDEWMPPGAEPVLASEGLAPAMKLTGMVAEALAPPRRSAPPELEIRTGADHDMVRALFDVNSLAYGMPVEMGQASVRPGMFTNEAWCAAGYVDGMPVSVAATYRVGACLYVAWVATIPSAQGRGYAETVMRRTLADGASATGLRRTVLHASDAGRPLYNAMGYHTVTAFTFYAFGLGHGD